MVAASWRICRSAEIETHSTVQICTLLLGINAEPVRIYAAVTMRIHGRGFVSHAIFLKRFVWQVPVGRFDPSWPARLPRA